MKISVIICTYTEKRWDTLVAAITSVQQQSMSPQEIIVVSDNNPALAVRVRAQFTLAQLLPHSFGSGNLTP